MQPKYWKGIKTLLTFETIASIIAIVFTVVHLIISLTTGLNHLIHFINVMISGNQADIDSMRQDFWIVFDVYSLILAISNFFVLVPSAIVSIIFVAKVKGNYPKVTDKKSSIKWGILSIIAGVLGFGFAIIAGILILITKKSDFSQMKEDENVIDVQ